MVSKNIINDQIRQTNVILIVDGKNQGIINTAEALNQARLQGLDLVQVGIEKNNEKELPICKIMDYGKFRYDQNKKNKKQKKISMKEIRLRLVTEEQDLKIKVNKVAEMIAKGHPVKINMQIRGREHRLRQEASEKMVSICSKIDNVSMGKIEHSENNVSVVLMPRK